MAEPTGPTASSIPSAPAPEPPQPPQRPTLIDTVIDLLQTVRDWIRQELGDAVHDKVAIPLQRVGTTIGAAIAAGCLVVIGLVFVAVALFMWLGQLITYPGAFLLVGLVYLGGAAAFLYVKSRSMVR